MSGLVDRNGLKLVTAPPSGFYTATVCPSCGNPIFYHGGGTGTQMDAMQGEHTITIEPAFYTTCLCDFEQEKMERPRIPPSYDPIAERMSIDILFTKWHEMLESHNKPQLRVVAKDGEVVDETVSTADTDPLG